MHSSGTFCYGGVLDVITLPDVLIVANTAESSSIIPPHHIDATRSQDVYLLKDSILSWFVRSVEILELYASFVHKVHSKVK